tara:strand:- start:736 stop:1746 length:1011 start_codon:yes stop_codon:yes gene_type:complete
MKLIDILREVEGEEDGMKQLKVQYDLAIQPTDIPAALNALDNIDNYGIYAQNLRDPKVIDKIFGFSNPGKKTVQAQTEWNEMTPEKRLKKIDQIKNDRIIKDREGNIVKDLGKETWNNTLKLLEKYKPYQEWVEENGDNPEEYLSSLDGVTAGSSKGLKLFGSRAETYFPFRSPENMKKYAGRLEKDVHFMVKDGKIVFPLENSPYKPKAYLQKVMKTIMDNSGLEYEIVDVEKTDDKGEVIKKPEKKVTPPLSVTADTLDKVEKIRSQFQKEIGDVPTANYTTEPVEVDGKRKYKLVVTGISPDQRQKLLIKKASLKEGVEFDLDLYLMQKRAGL